jgi:hypothetical protein
MDVMDDNSAEEPEGSLVAQFLTIDGEIKGPQVYLPADTTPDQLQALLNSLLENARISYPPLPSSLRRGDVGGTRSVPFPSWGL